MSSWQFCWAVFHQCKCRVTFAYKSTARVLEAREFRTSVVERLFDELLRVLPNDPQIALCGLDNTAGRRMLDAVGFKYLVEAGQLEQPAIDQVHESTGTNRDTIQRYYDRYRQTAKTWVEVHGCRLPNRKGRAK